MLCRFHAALCRAAIIRHIDSEDSAPPYAYTLLFFVFDCRLAIHYAVCEVDDYADSLPRDASYAHAIWRAHC